jgi:hypothetical protein
MSATDLDTRAYASESYYSNGASIFEGSTSSAAYFTGLMTEQYAYLQKPAYMLEQTVKYNTDNLPLQSAYISIEELNESSNPPEPAWFAYEPRFNFAVNPYRLQTYTCDKVVPPAPLACDGITVASTNAYEFITGN